MAGASQELHEAEDRLSGTTKDLHRALVSLQEELEAIDWYQQRVEAAEDDELKEILAHNRDEEKEHAAMVLEWIRRHDPGFDGMLREYLFRPGRIVAREAAAADKNGGNGEAPAATLGSLRRGR
ncbi:MAG: ferritin-like domain-containing protein [Candidatus Rokubacteria bacterium]|nr:ferritin-like domain-containing protein [Candidatus Rokubacteria bacterium]